MEIKFINTIIAAIIGAISALLVGRVLELKKQKYEQQKLENFLLGELLHIDRHYSFSGKDSSLSSLNNEQKRELRKQLLFTKYGKFILTENLDKYSFLYGIDITNLLQLSFRIRNTDHLIDMILEQPDKITIELFNEVQSRIRFIQQSIVRVFILLSEKNKNLQNLLQEAEINIKHNKYEETNNLP